MEEPGKSGPTINYEESTCDPSSNTDAMTSQNTKGPTQLHNTTSRDNNNETSDNNLQIEDSVPIMMINHNFSRVNEVNSSLNKLNGMANINDSSQNDLVQGNGLSSYNMIPSSIGSDIIQQQQMMILNAIQHQQLSQQQPSIQQQIIQKTPIKQSNQQLIQQSVQQQTNQQSNQQQLIQQSSNQQPNQSTNQQQLNQQSSNQQPNQSTNQQQLNQQLNQQQLNQQLNQQQLNQQQLNQQQLNQQQLNQQQLNQQSNQQYKQQAQQIFNSLLPQAQINPIMFPNHILMNSLQPGTNNPIGIPQIGLQPFPVHPLLLPVLLQVQQQVQKQAQQSQQAQIQQPQQSVQQHQQRQVSNVQSSSLPIILPNTGSKISNADEANGNQMGITSSPKINTKANNTNENNDSTMRSSNQQIPNNNNSNEASTNNLTSSPNNLKDNVKNSPSLPPIGQLPPTILPLPTPGISLPQAAIAGQGNFINPFLMIQRMSSNPMYLTFNPQLTGATIPNANQIQVPHMPTIPIIPPQGNQHIPQMMNLLNNGGVDNQLFSNINLSGALSNELIGNNGGMGLAQSSNNNCLLENDLERLHSHAESLVKTLIETSVPKAGIRLRLEWDRRRYCFKFTVYQTEEVRDSLGYQKKRLIPIDQDELFVNVNASKQLSIDNIEKAMWSAFVSVRHTLAKYCDRQAGQRRQTGSNISSSSSGRNLGQHSLIKMDDNGLLISNGKTKNYKKDEIHDNVDKKYISGSNNSLISMGINGVSHSNMNNRSYKSDLYPNATNTATNTSNANVGRSRRGYGNNPNTTTTRSGRFVSLKYGYDDIMLSDDDLLLGEQEYAGRKGRNKSKYTGGSSSGEDDHNNLHNMISNNISSSSNNRYAKTYITTHRGRRTSSYSTASGSGLGVYRTRGSTLSSDIYGNDSIGPSSSSISTGTPIFVLQKDEPGKNHSLVGLYAEWVDKHTIWDIRKGPLKTVFVSEGFKENDYANDKRETLKFTTNNYLKWDPSHITNDLRGIHIPLSIAGEYFGLLRKERTNEVISNFLVKKENIETKSSQVNENITTPITIKGNHVPNTNQIRFVSNDENYRVILANINEKDENNDNNANNDSIHKQELDDKLLENKLLELEAVDSVLVSTIQTTAALEQRKKRENKHSSCISIPTGSFLTCAFSYNNEHSDSTNEDENIDTGITRSIEENEHLININSEEIEEYKYLVLRFMHQQNGNDNYFFENNQITNINGANKEENSLEVNIESNSNSLLNESTHNNQNSLTKSRFTSRGLKRRGSLRSQNENSHNQFVGTTNLDNNNGSINTQSVSNNHCNNNVNNTHYSFNSSSQTGTNSQNEDGGIGGAIAASAMLETLITSVRGNSSDRYRQQLLQAYPQNRFVAKKKCKETNEILAKCVNDLANEYCNRNFGSSNLADGYINAFNSHVLKNCNK